MLASGMLRSCGNMYTPTALNILMCLLDVVFNFFLIFPTRTIDIAGVSLTVPGAGLGVPGAAIGTALAYMVVAALLMRSLCIKSPELRLTQDKGSFRPTKKCFVNAMKIALPMPILSR